MRPYNPLDKNNLGVSVTGALLQRTPVRMSSKRPFNGAGVYAIYYIGNLEHYGPISEANRNKQFSCPIYVGKAVHSGRRKGGTSVTRRPLFQRLKEHATSIDEAQNLRLVDFWCRYLVVDDIWIPLGERLLIDRFKPIWNSVVDGFGNHDPGGGRSQQARSNWDVLHPGRSWAEKLQPGSKTQEALVELVAEKLDTFDKKL